MFSDFFINIRWKLFALQACAGISSMLIMIGAYVWNNLFSPVSETSLSSNFMDMTEILGHELELLGENAPFQSSISVPLLMWWDGFSTTKGLKTCETDQCLFVDAQNFWRHPQTAAIFFYGSDLKRDRGLPLPRKPGVDWALLHEESPKNEMIFNHGQWLQYFNHTATFRQKSDWPLTYQYAPSLNALESREYWLDFETKEQLQKDEHLADIVYVQSNCDSPMDRDAFVQELMQHLTVDSYGKCLNNRDLPKNLGTPESNRDDAFLRLLSKYKFVLSIENAACPDYVTEKLWTPLVVGSIPVYLGANNVHEFLPTHKSAILVDDFRGMSDLVDHIRTIASNKQLYYSHLAHKTKSVTNVKLVNALKNKLGDFVDEFECLVCRRVHQRKSISALGFKPETFKANVNHYGCPYPKTALEILNGKTSDVGRNFWQDRFAQSEVEAQVLAQYMEKNANFSIQEFEKVLLTLLKQVPP